MTLGTDVPGTDLFDAMKQSPVMKQRGYGLLYEKTYTVQRDGYDGHGLCYVDSMKCKTYIHVRIDDHGIVNCFEYEAFLDVDKTAKNDMNELLQELNQKFP